ncbi:hypothetical protein G6F57_011489 [Rhizopus arrhizus]|nr:hypothetical protein G6F30_011440 [Rhizopus arrhizus]KAG0975572.1 hypothetical protein G6F29_011440 [Rhizopus arrhizus]KAG0982232.1 hypothetical protein G6F28_011239 [Rhizopus arrhizus]KAG1002900.1 hypothetical protein G6F27_011541 [Rhizopus arrhizus]KAG1017726.1 hypothetical protein G6F26_011509 [Rhizopus arrhizus]
MLQGVFVSFKKHSLRRSDYVKAYICNFESAEAAKKNLQKMKIAFTNVRGKKKRGPGVDIDLKLLYTEARATTAITVAGWNTLAASVEQLGNAYISNQYISNRRSDDNNDKNTSSSEEEADSTADDNHYDEQDDNNLSSQFHKYKNAATFISEKQGFYVDSNLHEILSLSDVLFLKENEYSDEQINHFGATNLDRLHNAVIEKYFDLNAKFDTNLYNQISEELRNFRSQNNPRVMKERINDLAKNADNNDYRLIDILINWLNKQVPDTDTRRPDGHIYKMKQRNINCSVGFVEVRSEKSDSIKRHENMIRLTAFCKDALEMQSSKAMVAVQVVGKSSQGQYLPFSLYTKKFWQRCCTSSNIESLNIRQFNSIFKDFRLENLQKQRDATNSVLISACRPTLSVDPILWLPMSPAERSRLVRWRLGWLPGGVPKPCIYHPNDLFTRSHSIRCLHMHRRLQMPFTEPDPLSFLLNKLPAKKQQYGIASRRPDPHRFSASKIHPPGVPPLGTKFIAWLCKD